MIRLRDKRDKVEVYGTLEQGVTTLHIDYESELDGKLYKAPPGSECRYVFGWGHQESWDGTETMTDEHGDRLFIKTSQGHPEVPERFLEPFCDGMSDRTFIKVPVALEFYSNLSDEQMKREIDRVMLALDADLLPGTGLFVRLAAESAETVNATEMALVLGELEVDPRNVGLDQEGRDIDPPHPNLAKEEGPDAGTYDPERLANSPIEGDLREHQSRPGHWDDHPEYPAEDWQAEVANGDTRQSYREWCESRRELDEDMAEADGQGICRTCGERYDLGGDGFDGECPSCADKTDQKENPENYEE